MKSIGLIGGTSWHSTIEYYRLINEQVNAYFGDNTNPPLMLYNLNQSRVHRYQARGDWQAIADLLVDAGSRLQHGGVDALLFCANTPHRVYEQVASQFDIPILHIADATAKAIKAQGLSKVGLIGTRFTMKQDFLTNRLNKKGVQTVLPHTEEAIVELHRIIQEELVHGEIKPSSKQYVCNEIQNLVDYGIEGIVLGCTEFPLLVSETDFSIPTFDTIKIHAQAAVDFLLT